MVRAKIQGDNVELTVLLGVVERPYGNTCAGDGYNYVDLKSYGFNLTVTPKVFAEFIEELTMAFFEYQLERAAVSQNELDEVADSR